MYNYKDKLKTKKLEFPVLREVNNHKPMENIEQEDREPAKKSD